MVVRQRSIGKSMHDIEILAIIWISVFAASVMATKTRLTPVLWYLFFGALLTNIGLLPTELPIFIVDLAELGIIIIMFSLGFEEENPYFPQRHKTQLGNSLLWRTRSFPNRLHTGLQLLG